MRSRGEFLVFLREVEKSLLERTNEGPYQMHLIMGNYVTYKVSKVSA
ncbi:hypothetical protein [Cerasicoccus frondis]|nr:hypothetical protein [Cerasicoccus frondis]